MLKRKAFKSKLQQGLEFELNRIGWVRLGEGANPRLDINSPQGHSPALELITVTPPHR